MEESRNLETIENQIKELCENKGFTNNFIQECVKEFILCMLSVVAGLKSTNVFELISRKMIGLFHTRRGVIYALVFGTFFFDMIVANDMSLITFLPLTYIVLHSTNNDKYLFLMFLVVLIIITKFLEM